MRTAVIHTPEGIAVPLELAPLARRLAAWLIDSAIQLVALAFAAAGFDDVEIPTSISDAELWVFALTLTSILYFSLSESLTQGRTIGKAISGLRVVRNDGGRIDARTAIVRNTLRLIDTPFIDAQPWFFPLGAILILLDPQRRRLGDRLAKTIAIREARWEVKEVPGWTLLCSLVEAASWRRLNRFERASFVVQAHALSNGLLRARREKSENLQQLEKLSAEVIREWPRPRNLELTNTVTMALTRHRSALLGALFAWSIPLAFGFWSAFTDERVGLSVLDPALLSELGHPGAAPALGTVALGRIAILQVLGGVVAGLGTLVAACASGLQLGATLGHGYRVNPDLFSSNALIASGPALFAAMIFAATAGFVLGGSILMPGRLARRVSLQLGLSDVLRLGYASALFWILGSTFQALGDGLEGDSAPIIGSISAFLLGTFVFSGLLGRKKSSFEIKGVSS